VKKTQQHTLNCYHSLPFYIHQALLLLAFGLSGATTTQSQYAVSFYNHSSCSVRNVSVANAVLRKGSESCTCLQRVLCSALTATSLGAPFNERSCEGMGSSTIVPKGYHFGKHRFEGYVYVTNTGDGTPSKNVSLCTDMWCRIPSCRVYPVPCGGGCVAVVGGPMAWQGRYMKIECSGSYCGDSGFTEVTRTRTTTL